MQPKKFTRRAGDEVYVHPDREDAYKGQEKLE